MAVSSDYRSDVERMLVLKALENPDGFCFLAELLFRSFHFDAEERDAVLRSVSKSFLRGLDAVQGMRNASLTHGKETFSKETFSKETSVEEIDREIEAASFFSSSGMEIL